MERRAVLAAIASLPGVALLPGSPGSVLDPDAHEIIGRALRRPESVGPEVLQPLDTLIMGLRHLDDTLGGRYVAEPANGMVLMMGDLLPAAAPSTRRPLFSLAASAAQLAGWIAVDGGDSDKARELYDQAMEWATAADDQALIAHIWSCRADHAGMHGNPVGAVGAAEAGRRIAGNEGKKLRAWIEAKAGRAYALAGNLSEAVRAMDEAAGLLAEGDSEDSPAWLYHFRPENLTVYRGIALIDAGQGLQAAEQFGEGLDRLSSTFVRSRGLYLAYQAHAFHIAGDVRQACDTGAQAVQIGRQTGSAQTVEKVRGLYRSFDGEAAQRPEVRALDELLREA
jgi:tetratricopeptide (TPR) repeat protein